jgi:hypothetical protein
LDDYDSSSGKGIPILVRFMDKPSSIAAESIMLQSLIKPINIKRLYVKKSDASVAKKMIAELLGGGN